MIKLGNLKTGQTKQLDGGITVTKEDGHYRVTAGQGTAQLRFLKDEREWRFVVDGDSREHTLPEGTTGATAVEVLITNWPAAPAPEAAPAPAPEAAPRDERESVIEKIKKLLAAGNDRTLDPAVSEAYLGRAAALMAKYSVEQEELRRAEGGDTGQGDDEIITWELKVNARGGHAPHRVAAFMSVIAAFGAGTYYTHYRSRDGYKGDVVTVYAIAQAGVIEQIKAFLAVMETAMELQADAISRRESNIARQTGGHHSLAGCRARRGFMRGFGQGIADRLTQGTHNFVAEDTTGSKALVVTDRRARVEAYMALHHGDIKPVRSPQYSTMAYAEGRERGRSFASPAINEPAAGRVPVNA